MRACVCVRSHTLTLVYLGNLELKCTQQAPRVMKFWFPLRFFDWYAYVRARFLRYNFVNKAKEVEKKMNAHKVRERMPMHMWAPKLNHPFDSGKPVSAFFSRQKKKKMIIFFWIFRKFFIESDVWCSNEYQSIQLNRYQQISPDFRNSIPIIMNRLARRETRKKLTTIESFYTLHTFFLFIGSGQIKWSVRSWKWRLALFSVFNLFLTFPTIFCVCSFTTII